MSDSLHRFNLGRDCTVILIGPYGRVDLTEVTDFEVKQKTDTVAVKPLNGPPMEAHGPAGMCRAQTTALYTYSKEASLPSHRRISATFGHSAGRTTRWPSHRDIRVLPLA